jgi:peroxiredoxin
MYPHERSLVNQLKNEPFVLLGVNSEATVEKLRAALKRENITWPSFFDGGGTDGPIATRWGVNGWPTTFVLDHQGIIRARGLRDEALASEVEKLLPAARQAAKR